jgi:predicted transcriptional regulator
MFHNHFRNPIKLLKSTILHRTGLCQLEVEHISASWLNYTISHEKSLLLRSSESIQLKKPNTVSELKRHANSQLQHKIFRTDLAPSLTRNEHQNFSIQEKFSVRRGCLG